MNITPQSIFFQYLEKIQKSKIFFVPTRGNPGDILIRLGAEYALQKANCSITDNLADAEYIIINGGGFFNPYWGDGQNFGNNLLRYYRQNAPNTPLIMAPQTFKFTNDILQEFLSICQISSASIILFARELYSYELLSKLNLPNNVEIKISQDLAFELKDSTFIKDYKKKSSEEYCLLCMRLDKESSFSLMCQLNDYRKKAKNLKLIQPITTKIFAKMQRLTGRWLGNSLYNDIINQFGFTPLTRLHKDIAYTSSLDEYCNAITKSAMIITERLHVGILGYLLNKPVIFISNPNYHKIRAVYEYSMKGTDLFPILYELSSKK
ncbi:Exopolysaccharide biosynthesis protein-like protein [Gloeothece citriformis PCC 7424]|uniref:Exopolysaccharide biosynthesis protein-like protein n=1 Tax=Gloeothece citriformis (strain PCC 7424) TaxID=65393 RepID=B7KEP7_GLOC7|nr:polysaccharide pyruvyl transferase family protein [Gloeothece citriformis]ACK69072.1 Exopolysaccharide biosynthesis protein-like protein [Gloeothece citriformis PCC 7424]